MTQSKPRHVSEADVRSLTDYIRRSVEGAGADGVVLGLSGGLDSAVVTKLCVDAIGAENVLNIFMPFKATSDADREAAKRMSDAWGTELRTIDIGDAVCSISDAIGEEQSPLDSGNISSRVRMSILYNFARRTNRLVMGTSNRSEVETGYFTKFGDNACDVQVISRLYKTQVRELARLIGVPEDVIDKPPSAGFWDGQTDESEMGVSYSELDRVLSMISESRSDAEI